MGIRSLRIDTTDSFSLAGTNVIPVLNNAPTLTGFNPSAGPAAALVTLSDLATYFGGGGGVTWPLLAPVGSDSAPSFAFTDHPTVGFYYNDDWSSMAVTPDAGDRESSGLLVQGCFFVGVPDNSYPLLIEAYPDFNGGTQVLYLGANGITQVSIGSSAEGSGAVQITGTTASMNPSGRATIGGSEVYIAPNVSIGDNNPSADTWCYLGGSGNKSNIRFVQRVADPTNLVAGDFWWDGTVFKYYNGAAVKTLATV